MTKNIIDARGELCPKPLIMAKKGLNDDAVKEEFALLVDNETAKENVERFLKDNKVLFQTSKKENYFYILVSKTGNQVTANPEEYCTPAAKKEVLSSHVICIKSDKMGMGNDELGAILMKGFVNTIKEITPLPEKIVFYNSGVMLTANDSPVIESIKELEKSGVQIVVCGTCADFYKIKEKMGAGTISNMYNILEILTKAGKVVCP